jgi:solute carrier family 25 phosphate transporter 3
MQSDPEKYTQGVIQAAKDIVRVEGLGFLLAGLGPTVVGYGLEGGLKFGFYETFKKLLATATPIKVVNFLMASVIAGGVASIVLCPMEETRIKMVGDASWTKENIITGLVRLVREDGIFSSFGGLPAMLSKQIPYTMGKQVSFDIITKVIYGLVAHFALSASDLTWTISVASAFIASLFACLSSQPGDMILTATYKAAAGSDKSFGGVVSNILKTRGVGGFFIGLQARFAHVASIITSQLVIYDIVKVALGLPSTGAH